MKINVWSYKEEYKSIRKHILKEVDKVFSSGQLILGKNEIGRASCRERV